MHLKVLAVNTQDIVGGAAKAAHRLHTGLRQIGVESIMLVQVKTSDDPFVINFFERSSQKIIPALRYRIDKLPLKFYKHRENKIWSVGWWPSRINKYINKINPDIVHMHWITGGFISISELRRIKKPIIWTLHDAWPFTGGCHYFYNCDKYIYNCGACPQLGSSLKNDLSKREWKKKNKNWRNLNLVIVTPSNWLAKHAKKSSLFSKFRIEVIPNGLDLSIYKPIDKQFARKVLNLPLDKKIVLFGAINSTSNERKGFKYLKKAIEILSKKPLRRDVELVIFGTSNCTYDLGLKINCLGKISDEITLALVYSAADVFVAPSIQDNLPNTVMEALACGTPCVAFNIGGMPDMIDHNENGYLAQPFDSVDLANGIEKILSEDSERFLVNTRKKVEENFEITKVARRYYLLYQEVLNRREYQ